MLKIFANLCLRDHHISSSNDTCNWESPNKHCISGTRFGISSLCRSKQTTSNKATRGAVGHDGTIFGHCVQKSCEPSRDLKTRQLHRAFSAMHSQGVFSLTNRPSDLLIVVFLERICRLVLTIVIAVSVIVGRVLFVFCLEFGRAMDHAHVQVVAGVLDTQATRMHCCDTVCFEDTHIHATRDRSRPILPAWLAFAFCCTISIPNELTN